MEAYVDQSGWASDDDGNRWFVGTSLAGTVAVGTAEVSSLVAQERHSVQAQGARAFQVAGSTGTHTVRNVRGRWSCTCKGFQFRRKCKHINSVSLR